MNCQVLKYGSQWAPKEHFCFINCDQCVSEIIVISGCWTSSYLVTLDPHTQWRENVLALIFALPFIESNCWCCKSCACVWLEDRVVQLLLFHCSDEKRDLIAWLLLVLQNCEFFPLLYFIRFWPKKFGCCCHLVVINLETEYNYISRPKLSTGQQEKDHQGGAHLWREMKWQFSVFENPSLSVHGVSFSQALSHVKPGALLWLQKCERTNEFQQEQPG